MTTPVQFNAFNFNSSAVRVITDPNQEHWFCGTDVCSILGYTNSRKALQDHCKEAGVTKRYISHPSGRKEAIFINEPNLYRLIIKSRKPEAEKFEAWVFEEVLPQIRQTGQYSQNNQQIAPLAEPKITMELTKKEWLRFASMWFALYNSLEVLATLEKPLRTIGSPFGATAYTHATEYQTTLGVMKRILEPMLADFEVDPFEEAHYHKALTTLRQYQPKGLGGLVRI
ncbi:P22AR C-terminal domain-containing protein [Mannheimia pernigra]|uniref:P22AR C-terminal domain-containing protein n=1 Tax=Mannheimia pernigra TaxID=111844 RepID=UPI001F37E75F|nr:P22AR C-terminal domain-containing protein [Mannheimia pernigra]